jgi:hypothetical protein
MVRSCGHDNRITVTDHVFLLVVKDKLGIAFFNAEELVDVGMHFVADFLSSLQTHHHQLAIFAGEQDLAEKVPPFLK